MQSRQPADVWTSMSQVKAACFERRKELAWPVKLAMAAAMAALTGVCAQIRIPMEPVPITGQVFAVLLSGVLLGAGYGAVSQLAYVVGGAAGIPWFAGASSGNPGVTGGYLIGFIIAAYVIGALTERRARFRTFRGELLAMGLGILIIYACGAGYFAAVTRAGLVRTLQLAVMPFIIVDLGKALCAAVVARSLLPARTNR